MKDFLKDIKVVPKVWGIEFWLFNNRKYCAKILIVKKDYHVSYHRHLKKDETFHLMQGRLLVRKGNKKAVLEPLESIRIRPKEWHQFYGMKECVVLEVSTHHSDSDTQRKTKSGKGKI